MRSRKFYVVLFGVLACCGCARQKSTEELMGDLKSGGEKEQIVAARLLPQRKGDVAHVVPALIEGLKNKSPDVRWSSAIGLGYFGDEAKEAVPALQTALSDRDARVREGAGVALSRIDPAHFQKPKPKPARGS
jgi:HEAT repeat protein